MVTLSSDMEAVAARLLADIGAAVRAHIIAHRGSDDARPVEVMGGDMVYGLDRKVEPIVLSAVDKWPRSSFGDITIVAEGIETASSGSSKSGGIRLLIDPIDGTRNLMYDKRAAWFLAAAAIDRGEETRLSDAFASTLVELPTSKQGLADTIVWSKGQSVEAFRTDLVHGTREHLLVRASSASSLEHGFAQVSNFFPGVKVLASELMERIALALIGAVKPGEASIFDDQYISTGGQFVELAMGKDRFCCDLRPIFYNILERRTGEKHSRGLACHPYDIAGLPAVRAAGVEFTDGFGATLDARFALNDPVHWCGYANQELRRRIEPVIQAWLREHL